MIKRSFVEKIETGEYITDWEGFEPFDLGCTAYSTHIPDINAEKYFKCVGEFNGIGNVSWWVVDELEKLTDFEKIELKKICAYNKYLRKSVSHDVVLKLAELFDCKQFHVYRTGKENIQVLMNQLNEFRNLIIKFSRDSLDHETIKFKTGPNLFQIKTFEEFKL